MIKFKHPIIFEYPIASDRKPNISDTTFNENLLVYLEKLGTKQMVDRFGKEKIKKINNHIICANGEFNSWRYLYKNEEEEENFQFYIGVIQGVSSKKEENIISNIYVRPDYRRKKIASEILKAIKKEKKNILLDKNFSLSGAAFFVKKDK